LEAFVSAKEEELLMKEVSKSMRRKRYQYDHWDGAITGYRETEKVQWISENEPVINRLALTASRAAVGGCTLELLPTIHVLDLAKDGYIKPHVDSVKFCGRVIAGISLLSPSLMNFVHKDNSDRRITILLPSCSLYIIRDEVRYQYTHEILPDIHTPFKGQSVARGRRVSIIARSAPMDTHL
jgi:alkylated DNA repair protein alkB family protein 7